MEGRKTATRRLLRPPPRSAWIVSRRTGRRRRRAAVRTVEIAGHVFAACRYEIGHSYAVQPGRTKRAIGRLLVTSVSHERVGEIDFTGARAEGFRTTDQFKAYWARLYEPTVMHNVDEQSDEGIFCEPPDDEFLVELFDQRHANTLVWVITFQLDTSHHPRLLVPAAGDERDADELRYTEDPGRALRDEPEAIDAGLLAYYTADAHDRFAGLPGRREEALRRRYRSLANRLRQSAADAVRSGVDVSAELDLIEQHLAVLERRRKAVA
jgi:hypothetical protein